MPVRLIAASLALFVLAGLCEVGGGYLVWSWWRNGASWLAGLVGALVLILYGIVPTYQTTHFGRVYAAYGGRLRRPVPRVGWAVDGIRPDRLDVAGGMICLAGVAVIMYGLR